VSGGAQTSIVTARLVFSACANGGARSGLGRASSSLRVDQTPACVSVRSPRFRCPGAVERLPGRLRKAPPRYGLGKVRGNYSRKVMVEGKGFVWRGSLHHAHLHASRWTGPPDRWPTLPNNPHPRNPAQPVPARPSGWISGHRSLPYLRPGHEPLSRRVPSHAKGVPEIPARRQECTSRCRPLRTILRTGTSCSQRAGSGPRPRFWASGMRKRRPGLAAYLRPVWRPGQPRGAGTLIYAIRVLVARALADAEVEKETINRIRDNLKIARPCCSPSSWPRT
jgi:hypothetical protein